MSVSNHNNIVNIWIINISRQQNSTQKQKKHSFSTLNECARTLAQAFQGLIWATRKLPSCNKTTHKCDNEMQLLTYFWHLFRLKLWMHHSSSRALVWIHFLLLFWLSRRPSHRRRHFLVQEEIKISFDMSCSRWWQSSIGVTLINFHISFIDCCDWSLSRLIMKWRDSYLLSKMESEDLHGLAHTRRMGQANKALEKIEEEKLTPMTTMKSDEIN